MDKDRSLYDQQMELEKEMLDLGHAKVEQRIAEGYSGVAPKLVKAMLSDLTETFVTFMKKRTKTPARDYLRRVKDPRAAAYITAKLMLNAASAEEMASEPNTAANIGEAVLDHLHIEAETWETYGQQRVPDQNAQLHIGTACVGAFFETFGEQHVERKRQFNGATKLQATAKLDDLYDREPDIFLTPRFLPCVLPPKPWEIVTRPGKAPELRGGYYTPALRARLAVVRGKSAPPRSYLETLAQVTMPVVIPALNAVQATAWKINRRIYDILRAATVPDVKSAAHRALEIASRFLDDAAIYFPFTMQVDGRLNPVPVDLNPYGEDAIKALLTFTYGKPLGSAEAADRLAVHGANTFGIKGTLSDRIQWVRENEADILDIAADPLRGPWWFAASDPWQFLAFCFEWHGYHREGLDFVSSLPIMADGSCNGLQHFSAMLRDEVGGAAVNLVPSDKAQDIYQQVANKVGLERSVVKPCVMNYAYGMTPHGRWDALEAGGLTRVQAVKVEPRVLAAIKETVLKASEVMEWLQDIARRSAKAQRPVYWVTPAGFLVWLGKFKMHTVHVMETVAGHRKRVPFKVPALTPKTGEAVLSAREMVTAIAADFVHSMDASHLMLTVVAAIDRGISSLAVEHDSFGTVAADAPALGDVLRQTFVKMYEEHDVLMELRDRLNKVCPALAIPEPPKRGTLDIRGVLDSKYSFA